MVSTTNDPVMSMANAGPTNAIAGTRPPLRECLIMIFVFETPLALAVRIKSWERMSSIPARVIRAK